MCKNGRIWRWVDHTVGHSTLSVMFGTILYFMCIYLCSHIIGVNEKENRRERDIPHTHHLIGVVVSNLTTHGMLILVAGVRQLRDTYEVTC